jgi:hypothetical protein
MIYVNMKRKMAIYILHVGHWFVYFNSFIIFEILFELQILASLINEIQPKIIEKCQK